MKRREREGEAQIWLCKARPRHPQKQKKEAAQVARAADNGVSGNNEESEQSVLPDSKYTRTAGAILLSVSGKPRWRFRLQHGQEMSGDRQRQFARRGTVRRRFHRRVSNGLNKAYFLRENDPVFNGYVMKITGDSIVFQETLQDRLGKTFTREVTKKITTPAV